MIPVTILPDQIGAVSRLRRRPRPQPGGGLGEGFGLGSKYLLQDWTTVLPTLAPIQPVRHMVWPTQEAGLGNVTVYRFTVYDITSDGNIRSRRWGTREGVKAVRGVVMEDTGTEIDARFVGGEVEGLTERGFDPHPRTGFQTQVESGPRPF